MLGTARLREQLGVVVVPVELGEHGRGRETGRGHSIRWHVLLAALLVKIIQCQASAPRSRRAAH